MNQSIQKDDETSNLQAQEELHQDSCSRDDSNSNNIGIKRDKRDYIIDEIIDTEKSYVYRLSLINDVYILPLQESNLISKDDLQDQFGFWESLYSIHFGLYERMTEEKNNNTMCIGKIFKDFSFFLKMYISYVLNFEKSLDRRSYLQSNNKKFAEFLSLAEKDDRCNGLNIESLMIEPIQRIPRYRLLLEQLLKYTPSEHPEFLFIAEALQKISEVVTHNNEAIRDRENNKKLQEIMMSIDTRSRVNLFDVPFRKFIKEDFLRKQCRRGLKEFKFWLFSDKLMYGEMTSLGTFSINRQVYFSEMRISLPSDELLSNQSRHKGAYFLIESKAKSFIIWTKDEFENMDWYKAINNALLAYSQVLDTKNIAPIWTPNKSKLNCEECNAAFSIITLRHHCRNCGKLICGLCSPYRHLLLHVHERKPQRVCGKCMQKLSPKEKVLQHPVRRLMKSVSGLVASATSSPSMNSNDVYNTGVSPEKDKKYISNRIFGFSRTESQDKRQDNGEIKRFVNPVYNLQEEDNEQDYDDYYSDSDAEDESSCCDNIDYSPNLEGSDLFKK